MLYQILIYKTLVLSQPRQFWDIVRDKLANKNLYITGIGAVRLGLSKLQINEAEAKKLRAGKSLES